jgi:hypothetical protein
VCRGLGDEGFVKGNVLPADQEGDVCDLHD